MDNFDIACWNLYGCKDERYLEDITFGYDLQATLKANALIQQTRENTLNRWFDRQHILIKKEIEKQLGESFSNYKSAVSAYLKEHESHIVQENHGPVERKYNERRYAKEHQKTSTLKKLKLLRLRENELKQGRLTHSNYASFTYNGKALDQIQSLAQIAAFWEEERSKFSSLHIAIQNDYHTHLQIKELSGVQDSNHPLLEELLILQWKNYHKYDRWDQLKLMQAYLNKVKNM